MLKNRKDKAPLIVGRMENNEVDGLVMPVVVFTKWCKGCGICVAFCPKGGLVIDPVTEKSVLAHPELCIQCGQCELRCPDFAITRVKKENGNGEKEN